MNNRRLFPFWKQPPVVLIGIACAGLEWCLAACWLEAGVAFLEAALGGGAGAGAAGAAMS